MASRPAGSRTTGSAGPDRGLARIQDRPWQQGFSPVTIITICEGGPFARMCSERTGQRVEWELLLSKTAAVFASHQGILKAAALQRALQASIKGPRRLINLIKRRPVACLTQKDN